MSNVIVLNADYSYINSISWEKAICLIYKEKAVSVSESERIIYNPGRTASFAIPKVIKLIKYIKKVYTNILTYSKKSLFARDRHTCQYCHVEMTEKDCTIDHVIPKAKGGGTSWENCVCSCWDCNNIKGDRNLWDTHMALKTKPTKPTIADYIRHKNRSIQKQIDSLWKV